MDTKINISDFRRKSFNCRNIKIFKSENLKKEIEKNPEITIKKSDFSNENFSEKDNDVTIRKTSQNQIIVSQLKNMLSKFKNQIYYKEDFSKIKAKNLRIINIGFTKLNRLFNKRDEKYFFSNLMRNYIFLQVKQMKENNY